MQPTAKNITHFPYIWLIRVLIGQPHYPLFHNYNLGIKNNQRLN